MGARAEPPEGWAGEFSLPPGYRVGGYGRLLSRPEEAFLWIIYAPGGRTVACPNRSEIERTAWDDHRRRALHLVEGQRS